MIANRLLIPGLLVTVAVGLVAAQNQPAPESSAPREADERAIAQVLDSFAKAYNGKDAKALGSLFTSDAEIEDEDGEVTQGKEAIVARFEAAFSDKGSGTLSLVTDSLRFLGTDLAYEEGTAALTTSPDLPPRTNHYTVIYTRQDGRWLHARIRDEPSEDVAPHEKLEELSWLLGEWVNESDDAIVLTTCKWSDDGNFLLREFDIKIEGRVALRGTQRIGWDAQRKQFRVWVFDTGGGFAEGLMSRGADRWIVKGTGVRSDGRSVSFTNAITPLSKDRIRWESFDRTFGGLAVPGVDHFFLVRRAPLPGK